MRTFIALEISDEIKDSLGRIESHLKYAGADVKWVKPETIHLTLKFLGEISEEKAEDVKKRIDEATSAFKAFNLSVKDIGAFPKIESPRVIWVGLDKGASEATAIAGRIDEALSAIGFSKETRPFSPHLTIGRVRSSLNKAKLAEKIATLPRPYDPTTLCPSCKISSIILFRSTLTPHGSIYTKLHESPLQV